MNPRLVVLKIFMIFSVYVLNLLLFSLNLFLIFHNTIMIYNSEIEIIKIPWNNDTKESQKEKGPALMFMQSEKEIRSWNKMWLFWKKFSYIKV